MEEVILHYRESRDDIFWGHFTGACVFGTGTFLLPAIMWFFKLDLFFCILAGLVALGNALIFGYIAWETSRQPNSFECTLYRDRICCICPIKGMGSSFDLPLHQLREIRKEESGDSRSYILVAADGKRHWLTGNFYNPDRAFVDEILKLAPHVVLHE